MQSVVPLPLFTCWKKQQYKYKVEVICPSPLSTRSERACMVTVVKILSGAVEIQ